MPSPFDGLAATFVEHLGDTTPVQYTHGATTVAVVGIFEEPALELQGLTENAGIITADTSFSCNEDDLPAGYGEGDTLVRRGVTYATKAPMRDGHGMVRIPLLKQG